MVKMEANNPIISRHLVDCKAYQDKAVPVIVTSGESLTPYFINAEMLSGIDPEFLNANGNESVAIINEAIRLQGESSSFSEDIHTIALQVHNLFSTQSGIAVSGGQRRDWIFSGPVANMLVLPHVSLYKQERWQPGKIEIVYPGNESVVLNPNDRIPFDQVVHVSDLLTTGSSAYHVDGPGFGLGFGFTAGWIPTLRERGAEVNDLVTVVTRLQGGEELLEGLKPRVHVHSFVAIDSDFLMRYSKQPSAVLDYNRDARRWTEEYLATNGINVLIDYFNPGGSKLKRATAFLGNYRAFLSEKHLMPILEEQVKDRFGKTLKEIAESQN